MNRDNNSEVKIHVYEHLWYWLVTLVVFILAVPILLIKLVACLCRMAKR